MHRFMCTEACYNLGPRYSMTRGCTFVVYNCAKLELRLHIDWKDVPFVYVAKRAIYPANLLMTWFFFELCRSQIRPQSYSQSSSDTIALELGRRSERL